MKKSTFQKQKWYSILLKAFCLIMLFASSWNANAQVPYGVSSITGTYAQLNGGGITTVNAATQLQAGFASGNQDDGGLTVTLPFAFNYMGGSFTQMNFCTNGWISAGTSNSAIGAAASRTSGNFFTTAVPNNTISPLFKDMGANFGVGFPGSMRHGLTGTDVFTFQWDQAIGSGFSNTTANLVSFQISIYGPASIMPGRIEYLYGPQIGALGITGTDATAIGIEDGIGGANHFINALNGSQTLTTTLTTWPGNGNGYRFDPFPPCVAPVDEATNLSLTTISISQIDGSFTAAGSLPSGYLVVRYPNGAATTNPVNGISYSIGQSLGLGKIVAAGTGTTFSSPGLIGGTSYDFYVYDYNLNNSLCTGPVYNSSITTGQNSGTQSTAPCGSISSPLLVGPTGTYPTLSGAGGAIAAIAASGISAPLVIEIEPTYTGAGEVYPITMNYNACITATNTLTIRPQGGGATVAPITITSTNTIATIDLNGAAYVTIDGRPDGIGTDKFLIVQNTSTTSLAAGNAILIRNDASNNILTYLDVKAANGNIASSTVLTATGAVPGAIAIGTTAGITGNDNNTISDCDIHSTGANLGAAIYAANGTTAGSLTNNDNNTINNNNIFDFFLAGSASAGIIVTLGNNNYTITNNKIYQTLPRTYTASAVHRGIWVTPNTGTLTAGSGFNISNNTIGYSSSTGTGTYTTAGAATHTFNAFDLSLGIGTASSVQGNTVTNFSVATTSTSATAFVGMQIANGNVNVGTVTPNIIGSTSSNGAISFTTSGANGGVVGIRTSGGTGNTINIANNQVSGITVSGSSALISAGFLGINGVGGTNVNITNNTVGHATMANSIFAPTVVTAAVAQLMRGIVVNGGTTSTVTGNLVANMTTNTNATSATSTMAGILVSVGTSTVSNNVVRNLSSAAVSAGGGASSAMVGIGYTATTAPATVTGNTIHSLRLTNPTTLLATQCVGLFYQGPTTGTNVVQKNFIHSLSIASPTNSLGILTGMDLGISGLVTVRNNMIRLGINDGGSSIISPCMIRGISENGATSSVFHNSVYIGGSNVGTSAINTFAYQRSGTGGIDSVVNNIFCNDRSNAASGGKHYQVLLTTSSLNLLGLNYNVYSGVGNGAVFGNTGAADVPSYSAGWIPAAPLLDQNSTVGDPQYLNATGTAVTVNLHINPSVATPVELGGVLIASVTEDIDNQNRAGLSPTDIGADAGDFTPLNACGDEPEPSTIVGASAVCIGSSTTLSLSTGYIGVGISYQWASSTTVGGPYTTLLGTGSVQSTGNLTSPMYYICTISCSFSGLSFTTAEKTVLINTLPTVSVTSAGVICNPGGTAVTLTASGASTYAWSPTTGLTPTSGSPVAALPTTGTTYTVTGADANGCTATSTVVVALNPAITVNSVTATPATICPNGSSVLQASASSVGSYCTTVHTNGSGSGDFCTLVSIPGTTLNNPTGASPTPFYTLYPASGSTTATLTAGSTYTITLSVGTFSANDIAAWLDYNQNNILNDGGEKLGETDNLGVSASTSFVFTVPSGAVNGPTRLRVRESDQGTTGGMDPCNSLTWGETEDYTITIVGGVDPFTYSWSESPANASLASLTGNPVNANNIPNTTVYTVIASSAVGCTATGSATVAINPLTCTAPTIPALICSGQNFAVTANTSGGGLPFTYVWDDGMSGIYPNAQTITANLPSGAYTFTVTVTDNCNAVCTSTVSIVVNASPTGSASGPASALTYQPLTYSANGYNVGDNFQWQFSTNPVGPFTNVGINDDTLTTTASSAGTFYIQCVITNVSGCSITTNQVTTVVTAAGDQPCSAINLPLGLSGPYTNAGATVDAGEPVPAANGCNVQNGWCNSTLENTVWYSFVAPPSGKIVINTGSPLWDNQLALYSVINCADYLTYTQLAANDDGGDGSFAAKITSICLVPGQTYYLQLDGYSGTTNSAFYLDLIQETAGVSLSAKAILSGAYDAGSGLMHDSLRTIGQVPLTEPYTMPPYNKPVIAEPAGETTTAAVLGVTGANAIVDWVLIELRSSSVPATIVATRRALIQRDGDIVDVDGVSAVSFPSLSFGTYYVTAKHRNHLGVMSATALQLGPCNYGVVDFTGGSVWVKAGEVNGPRRMYGSVAALWSSDANRNKNSKYNGLSNDKQEVLNLVGVGTPNNVVSPAYRSEDLNMDGKVKYNNVDNDRNVIANTVGVSTPNNIVNQHTPN